MTNLKKFKIAFDWCSISAFYSSKLEITKKVAKVIIKKIKNHPEIDVFFTELDAMFVDADKVVKQVKPLVYKIDPRLDKSSYNTILKIEAREFNNGK